MRSWKEHWDESADFNTYVLHCGRHAQRWDYMHRVYHLTEEQRDVLDRFDRPMNLLSVVADGCTDSIAQIPLLDRVVEGSGLLAHRLLPQDHADDELLDRYAINGAHRTPLVFILSEDFCLVFAWGDSTLSRYRLLKEVRCEVGPAVSDEYFDRRVAAHSANPDVMVRTADELLAELERAQLLLQLSRRPIRSQT